MFVNILLVVFIGSREDKCFERIPRDCIRPQLQYDLVNEQWKDNDD